MSDVLHFIPAEIAKMVRAELKRVFPGVKFSVTSERYSLGSSVRVRWEGGPSEVDVRTFIGKYETGAYYDGLDEYHEERPFTFYTAYEGRLATGVDHLILHRRK